MIRSSGHLRVVLAAGLLLAGAGCAPSIAPPPPRVADAPSPDPAEVERLLFLVGDPGEAVPGRSPLMTRLTEDVERWSADLADGAVTIAWLGDLVYPVGVRPADHPLHARDTLRLHTQLVPITGPAAERKGVSGLFIPGNHDWGNTVGPEGRARLAIMASHIEDWREAGWPVRLLPDGGTLDPAVVEFGPGARLVMLDTQGWLGADDAARMAAIPALARALDTERTTVLLTHHPLRTGGNHGEARRLDDPLALLSRAGAVPQDLPAEPYRETVVAIREAIARSGGRPLLMASGHDHNLQLFRGPRSDEPRWSLVAGSASKLTPVRDAPEMVFGGGWPGYGRLFVLRDGGFVLQVEAGAADAQHCPQEETTALATCLERGAASWRTIWSALLADPPRGSS